MVHSGNMAEKTRGDAVVTEGGTARSDLCGGVAMYHLL